MGKRKTTTRKPQKKMNEKLDVQFSCLFCNHEKSVICTIDKKINIGTLRCKVCGQNFQSPINSLSQPVDIYSDWIDACEAIAEEQDQQDHDFIEKDDYEDEDEGVNY